MQLGKFQEMYLKFHNSCEPKVKEFGKILCKINEKSKK